MPPVDAPRGIHREIASGRPDPVDLGSEEGAAGYQLYRQGPGENALSQYTRTGNIAEWVDSPGLDGKYTYAIASVRQEDDETVGGMSAPVDADSDSLPPAPTPQSHAGALEPGSQRHLAGTL